MAAAILATFSFASVAYAQSLNVDVSQSQSQSQPQGNSINNQEQTSQVIAINCAETQTCGPDVIGQCENQYGPSIDARQALILQECAFGGGVIVN